MNLSQNAQRIKKSAIRVMYDLAKTKPDSISFTVGEPDFQTPKSIIDEATKYMNMGYTHYTPNCGIMPLREAIANKYNDYLGRKIDPENEVIVTVGASEAIVVAMATIMDPGDEIIIFAPYYTNYLNEVMICHCNAKIVTCHEENGFLPRIEDIEAAINKKTKMIMINSPCNPTGAEFDEKILRQIAELAIKHDLVVISDEVYRNIRYEDTPYFSIASMPTMAERTILIDSFSKTYAMTGWRMGYAIGPKWIISKMPAIHDGMVSCVNGPFQYAGAYALKNCDEDIVKMQKVYVNRKNIIVNGIRRIPGLSCINPKGTFYLFVNIKKTNIRSEEFCMGLLKETGMIIVPGSGFGECGEGFVRITYAVNENTIIEGLNRLETYVGRIMVK